MSPRDGFFGEGVDLELEGWAVEGATPPSSLSPPGAAAAGEAARRDGGDDAADEALLASERARVLRNVSADCEEGAAPSSSPTEDLSLDEDLRRRVLSRGPSSPPRSEGNRHLPQQRPTASTLCALLRFLQSLWHSAACVLVAPVKQRC